MYRFLLIFILFSSPLFAGEILGQYCDDLGGVVVDKFQCPKSKLVLRWDFCIAKNREGKQIFFDGCTGPSGGHKELFYPACIMHDFCYHHEPLTSGLSRRDCDLGFLKNALTLCQGAENINKCQSWARIMFKGLRGAGGIAFNCSKTKALYKDIKMSKR